jgi:hypothetical protein
MLPELTQNFASVDRIKEYLSPPTSANTRAIITCIILSFTYGVSFTVFETVGTPMTDTFYGWGVWQNGVLYAVLGVEAILWIAVQTIFLTKIFSDRTIVLAASFITAISCVLLRLIPVHVPVTDLVL